MGRKLDNSQYERRKMKTKICPKCNQEYTGYPATSRRDNKTKICSECGMIEAFSDFIVWKRRQDGKSAKSL